MSKKDFVSTTDTGSIIGRLLLLMLRVSIKGVL